MGANFVLVLSLLLGGSFENDRIRLELPQGWRSELPTLKSSTTTFVGQKEGLSALFRIRIYPALSNESADTLLSTSLSMYQKLGASVPPKDPRAEKLRGDYRLGRVLIPIEGRRSLRMIEVKTMIRGGYALIFESEATASVFASFIDDFRVMERSFVLLLERPELIASPAHALLGRWREKASKRPLEFRRNGSYSSNRTTGVFSVKGGKIKITPGKHEAKVFLYEIDKRGDLIIFGGELSGPVHYERVGDSL